MSSELHEFDRREIFLKIVRMQDNGVSLDESRTLIAAQFGIDVDHVCEIETEGIAKDWPPL
jgi:hypothetical protein